jgi:Flp pilus assembly CpaF family ATPase
MCAAVCNRTRFRDDARLMTIIQRIVSPIGGRADEVSPFVDARLPDGSRVDVIDRHRCVDDLWGHHWC